MSSFYVWSMRIALGLLGLVFFALWLFAFNLFASNPPYSLLWTAVDLVLLFLMVPLLSGSIIIALYAL